MRRRRGCTARGVVVVAALGGALPACTATMPWRGDAAWAGIGVWDVEPSRSSVRCRTPGLSIRTARPARGVDVGWSDVTTVGERGGSRATDARFTPILGFPVSRADGGTTFVGFAFAASPTPADDEPTLVRRSWIGGGVACDEAETSFGLGWGSGLAFVVPEAADGAWALDVPPGGNGARLERIPLDGGAGR